MDFPETRPHYRQNPARVALHFGLNGQPDRWGDAGQALGLHVGVMLGGTLLFLGIPSFIRRCPDDLINLPNNMLYTLLSLIALVRAFRLPHDPSTD